MPARNCCGEDGETRQPGDADEEVRPDETPPRDHPRLRPEAATGIAVHRPGQGRTLGKLVQAPDDEEQHHRAKRIGEPGPVPRVAEAEGDDEHGRHGGRDHGNGLGQDGGKSRARFCEAPSGRLAAPAASACRTLSCRWLFPWRSPFLSSR